MGHQEHKGGGVNKTQFKALLYRLPLGKVQDVEPFMTVLQNHPEYTNKVGAGIDSISIRMNRRNKAARELYIKRIDGSEIDISWVTCFTGKAKSYKSLLQSAMREAISPQILEFLKLNRVCNKCGARSHLEVDHLEPSFKKLSSIFEFPPQVFLDGKHNGPVLQESDEKIKWIKFHSENARLQVLCKSCHKDKTFNRDRNG